MQQARIKVDGQAYVLVKMLSKLQEKPFDDVAQMIFDKHVGLMLKTLEPEVKVPTSPSSVVAGNGVPEGSVS